MPLQPPNPDFLAKAPGPEEKSSPRRSRRSGWRLPMGVTGLVMLMLAMLFGVPELLV
jgi:hypothetical protein